MMKTGELRGKEGGPYAKTRGAMECIAEECIDKKDGRRRQLGGGSSSKVGSK